MASFWTGNKTRKKNSRGKKNSKPKFFYHIIDESLPPESVYYLLEDGKRYCGIFADGCRKGQVVRLMVVPPKAYDHFDYLLNRSNHPEKYPKPDQRLLNDFGRLLVT